MNRMIPYAQQAPYEDPRLGETGDESNALEQLSATANDESGITEVIRPAAIIPEPSMRAIASELMLRDARRDGHWIAEPSSWQRYDRPWDGADGTAGSALLVGTLQIAFGTPTRFEVTVFRATITSAAAANGWTVTRLCDEAFGFGGLTLATCPRAPLNSPPQPFRLH
jgi:hypothetical protein